MIMRAGTKARRHEGTKGTTPSAPPCLRASLPACLLRPAFTLTEILIVIGIIVLLLAMAVPAMRVLTGGRSIDGAENQLSAFLGRARGEAIALQEERGVMFFVDPVSDRVTAVEVFVTQATGARDKYLDLVGDRDRIMLPT